MSENKKSWDDIPSLNLQLDDEYNDKLKETKDSRRHHRASVQALKSILHEELTALPIRIATAEKGVFNGEIIDLSKSGVRITTPEILKKGEQTKVGFILNRRTITSYAITQWVATNDNGCMAGLMFKGLSEEDGEFIHNISSADLFNKIGKG